MAVLLATNAAAQTTDCSTVGIYTHCQTQQPPPPPQSDPSSVIYHQLRDSGYGGKTYQDAYRARRKRSSSAKPPKKRAHVAGQRPTTESAS